jgi:hypothetical protein
MITIGVDPDTHTLAVALMQDRALRWWFVTDVPTKLKGDDAVAAVAEQLLKNSDFPFTSRTMEPRWIVDKIVVEQMRVYPDTSLGTKGLNGLMRVASTGGAALAYLKFLYPNARYAMPTAPEWKGQIDKPAHHRQILAQVDDESRQTLMGIPARLRGHLLDAVGMALWAQGARAQRRDTRKDILAAARARARRAKG